MDSVTATSTPYSSTTPTRKFLPLDHRPSSDADIVSQENLRIFLDENSEATDAQLNGEVILRKLEEVVLAWARKLVESKVRMELEAENLSQGEVESRVKAVLKEEHCRILPFGSYALRVYSNETDIDLLCLGSKYIERKDFFEAFNEHLSQEEEVEQRIRLTEAYVPLLKFRYCQLDIDMVYCQLPFPNFQDLNIHDDNFMEIISHEKDSLSLNGARVTQFILDTVEGNTAFHDALEAIRIWARSRGIYSSVMGYLGGVSWAILVTKIVQLYPNANAATIVRKFFFFYSRWKWGPERPITLYSTSTKRRQWTSEVPRDRERPHMYIITPVIPCMNTSYNVTQATYRLLTKEFARAESILNQDMDATVTPDIWTRFFLPTRFFHNHANYLLIKMGAQDDRINFLWTNFIKTKIRNFVQTMERTTGNQCLATPYPRVIDGHDGKTYFAIGIDVSDEVLMTTRKLNLAAAVKQFVDVVYNRPVSSRYRSFHAQLFVFRARRRELPEWVFPDGERPPGWLGPSGGTQYGGDNNVLFRTLYKTTPTDTCYKATPY